MLLSGLGDRLAALFEVVNSLTHAFVSIIAPPLPPLLQPNEGQMNPGAKCVLRRHPFLSARLPVVARGWLLRRFIYSSLFFSSWPRPPYLTHRPKTNRSPGHLGGIGGATGLVRLGNRQ